MSTTPRPSSGVIHDLGYRPYAGPRHSEAAIAWALYRTGVRHAFGWGRSAKSKLLPLIVLALNLLPAVIVVGVMVMIGLTSLPITYAGYASTTQILVSLFVAAQSPILFSRDLRHGSISLYLARPLRPATYALTRWLSLWSAVMVFLAVPILVLYAGAVLAELDWSEQTVDAAKSLALVALLAAVLTSIGALISAWTTRRGFGVMAIIVVLLLGNGIVAIIQAIALDEGRARVGEFAGLLSPYSLYRGTVAAWFDGSSSVVTPPDGAAMTFAYVGTAVIVSVVMAGLLVVRYRKVVGR